MRRSGLGLVLVASTLVSAALPTLTYTPAPANEVTSGGLTLKAIASAPNGWVPPGGSFAYVLAYKTGAAPVASATVSVTLSSASVYESSVPAPISGNGSSGSPLTYTIGPVAANTRGSIVISARAKDQVEDPQVMWKPIPADVSMTVVGQSAVAVRSHGPKVTTLDSARYGDRPFPVVMVDFQDIKHCTGGPADHPDCTGENHTATALDFAVNSRTSGKSIWQLYQDLSFGLLFPDPTVMPRPSTPDKPFDADTYKFSTLEPNGTCNGTTVEGGPVPTHGTPAYPNRVEDGWYVLPGTQGYYGSDSNGAFGAVNPVAPTIDDGCGPTGKLVYDAATLADPDLDYNDFDTDKDGLVDFFNLVFPGVGGNTLATPTSVNNVWPHSSSLEYYYTDANGLKGYVSNDQFRNQFDQPMYYTDGTYKVLTTTPTAFKAYVRVGPYNVNPETAIDKVSVIAHEYGHSLGLPDFYSNNFDAFGSWELMGEDHFQFMTVFSRQDLGWVVPRPLQDGTVTMQESKYDTGQIHWTQPDGTPYVLTGDGIHNADVYRVQLPPRIVIDSVPSGSHAWHSGAGSDFGCAPDGGHNLDVYLPDLASTGSAAAVTLTFQSLYQIEWDWDYAFVMVSDDDGLTWTTLPSAATPTTTIQNSYNPNNAGCFDQHNNGITGVYAGGGNSLANPNRAQGLYPFGPFIQDQYDLTAYKGKSIILRFSYFTDPAAVFRGWFIDDIKITADSTVVYQSDFESGQERGRLFSKGWTRISTLDGSPADHAYYFEVRDRISNDFNGKGQDDRANGPTWQAGVSMIYTDEAFGYGNTGVDDHPAQTPVDSVPQPGNTSPNLNDAAFTAANGRNKFDGCTHIDNYVDPNGPDGNWKLPNNVQFQVTALSGLAPGEAMPASPATATLDVVVNPLCDNALLGPILAINGGYENPDNDGAYTMGWSTPPGSVGPNLLQEATVFQTALFDDAEGGLGQWTAASESEFAPTWTTSNSKPQHAPDTAFWATPIEAGFGTATLTHNTAIDIPPDSGATLSFKEWYFNEDPGCDPPLAGDSGFVDISVDGGPWETVYTNARPMGDAPDVGAAAYADEPLTKTTIDLSVYEGHSIKPRFRFYEGECDYFAFVTYGWYVDDITLEVNNFHDLLTTADDHADLTDKTTGTYYYRVSTRYPTLGGTIPSSWSNVVQVDVDIPSPPIALIDAPATVAEGDTVTLDGTGSSDPNGDPLTFSWAQTSGQAQYPVTLTGASTDTATFTAPTVCTDTPLGFQLTVGDGTFTDTADAVVFIDNINNPPLANAGDDFTAKSNNTVMLSAAASSDADCETLQYSWVQIGGPAASLDDPASATPSFTVPDAPLGTDFTFRLTVTDPDGVASSDDVTVTVTGTAPVEDIGNSKVGALSFPALFVLGLLALLRLAGFGGLMRISQSRESAKTLR